MNKTPNGWKSEQLGDHVSVLTGYPFSSGEFSENASDVTLVRGANIGQGFFKWNDTVFWPVEKTKDYQKFSLQVGDIVLAMDRPWIPAGVKYAWVTQNEMPCLLVQRVARIRGEESLNTDYIRHLLASNEFSIHVQKSITGTNVPHISKKDIQNFKILLPPISEQQKITEILSTWDEAIAKTKQLVASLQERKKGLMQRLLTGEVRFPGFDGEWQSLKLVELTNPGGLMKDGDWIESKDQDPNGEVRLIQLADIGDGGFLNKSSRFLTRDRANELKCTFLREDDILIARMPDPIGRACIFPKIGQSSVTAVDVCIVRVKPGIDNNWLMYAINETKFRNEIFRLSIGTTRTRISRKALEKIDIIVPQIEEQQQIAAVLQSCDKEIYLYDKKLEVLQQQKRGLMQRLLTGEVRVKV